MPFGFFPALGEAFADEGSTVSSQIDRKNDTYQSRLDQGHLQLKKLKSNLLMIESEHMGQHLVEAARADFNGDGLEDILIFEYCYATQGTMGWGGIRMITRRSEDGLFEEL